MTILADIEYTSWLDQLQPASWRGVPFAVESSETRRGRRTAVHEYPFRKEVWVEDLGRGVRGYSIYGFVVGDDCYQQEQALLDASEQPGSGVLVHPSLGACTVSLVGPVTTEQRSERGRSVGIRFEFIETADSVYPVATADTQGAVQTSALAAAAAAAEDFLSDVADALEEGADIISAGIAAVESWGSAVMQLAGDALLVMSAVAGLPGYFGRFVAGARSILLMGITTVDQAIGAVITARAAVSSASALCTSLAAGMSPTSDNGVCAAAQALTEALRNACADPADAVRLLSDLAVWNLTVTPSTAPIGAAIATLQTAMGQIFRRAALVSLANACATYQPASWNDAISLRSTVATLFDVEIIASADAGQDATYQALRALRTSVIIDLTTRGAQLAKMVTVTTPAPDSALSLAYRLYGDASRADQLIAEADPVHPSFMPTSFQALQD